MKNNSPGGFPVTLRPSLEERFWAKVEKTEGCWLWTGATSRGYGQINQEGRMIYAHRWAWESANGPVPEGLELDHLCRVRHCVNPAHLEPVTRRENVLRGNNPPARKASQTHCIHGHLFDAANTYLRKDRPARNCRQCKREKQREWQRASRASHPALAKGELT